MTQVNVDDGALAAQIDGDGPPLLLLHGFTGSATIWTNHITVFARYLRTIALDLIGHGRSDAPANLERYRMERCVDDVLGALDAAGVGRPTVLGYSMGGRVALHLAVASPERVGCLILVSASAGLMEPAERTARILADEALADFIETQGIEAFVDRWERLPLFASQSALPQEVRDRLRRQRLRNNPVGLANSLRGMGAGQQLLLWDKLPSIGVPTLLVVGEQDEKYCTIARAMAQLIPGARTVVVANAGHAVHLEQPSKFEEIVLGFLYDVGILNESAALAL